MVIAMDNHSHNDRFHVGIDAGSVSINCVVITQERQIVYEAPYKRHFGKITAEITSLIKHLYSRFGQRRIESISFTGNQGKRLAEQLGTFYEFETISEVTGTLFVSPDVHTIISMGGQNTALFQIAHTGHDTWNLDYFNTNGPCASGTGSFIDQQAQRLFTAIYSKKASMSPDQTDMILSDFIELGLKSTNPANVACRCTVFTKSDMIHLQNRGERLEDIIFGLHTGNARNYISTIVSNRILEKPIAFIGGLSLNRLQVKVFKGHFPDLIVPPLSTSLGALGVALQALNMTLKKDPSRSQVSSVNPALLDSIDYDSKTSIPRAAKLELKETSFIESNDIEIPRKDIRKGIKAYLGVDIGSTTTKYVLMDDSCNILYKRYVPTRGRPIETVQSLFKDLLKQVHLGIKKEQPSSHSDMNKSGIPAKKPEDRIEILGAATTGSGRNVVGDFLNADITVDEITAHAQGAVYIDEDVDTIFEIGGQDSKYIYIQDKYPLDFDMNKVCAAGTGSFLHELSNKYGINIVDEFQKIALSSDTPVKLSERCTVFMESDLVYHYQKGASKRDLMAGLCYAIVHNYLNRVVGKRRIGRRIMFLGGPSLNRAVVAAFENVLKRSISVPEHREVLGAYGAALLVRQHMSVRAKRHSSFRGFSSAVQDRMIYEEKVCHADPRCFNQCKLKIYNFDGRKSVWGGECGRYDIIRTGKKKKDNLFDLRQKIYQSYLDGICEELGDMPLFELDGRRTVGMQRALYGHQTGILWANFFDRLGFRLVMSPPTNAHISELGIESVMAETCYPVKVSHGHIRELMDKTAFLFIPTIINMPTPHASESGFYCPMVQSNSYMLRAALAPDPSRILNPVIHMKYDLNALAMELWEQLGHRLGVNRQETKNALAYALSKQHEFEHRLYKTGHKIIKEKDRKEHEPVIIVTGRPYNLYDERLNLRLGKNLAKIGISALPMDFIDTSSVDISDFQSMYWGLGAQILRTARFIKNNPGVFGIHITNFGCGADSFIEHFYRHIMAEKPYLILELDEHSAVAGAMTRIEAYKNVITNYTDTRHI